jgi:hypothetical protein
MSKSKRASAAKKSPSASNGLTDEQKRFFDIIKAKKKAGISVSDAAHEFYGDRAKTISRLHQGIFFRVIHINDKLKAIGDSRRIHKRNPGAGPGKQIQLFVA